jgi:hypothetical protein
MWRFRHLPKQQWDWRLLFCRDLRNMRRAWPDLGGDGREAEPTKAIDYIMNYGKSA